MNILNIFKRNNTDLASTIEKQSKEIEKLKGEKHPSASSNYLFSVSFNGEKNLGEIGPIKDYILDYDALRARSWQCYLDSEVAQLTINKFSVWEIGSGLKLQSEPSETVLKSEGITIDRNAFTDVVEARFGVYSKSRMSDYSGMANLHILAKRALINSIIGGDVLVVLRYIDNCVKVQLIDGAHLVSPLFGSNFLGYTMPNGNRIKNGIELSPTGEHVAYYVRTSINKIERIPAKGKSGLTMAFLVYGLEYRLDNVRGIPLVAAVLETIKRLERYSNATLGSAEERAKIITQIVHELNASGETPYLGRMANAFDVDRNSDLPKDVNGNELANKVAVSTNKQVFNMAPGSELKSLESKTELYFKDFFTVYLDIICAVLTIPPNVAMSKYDSNFSASRAALKDWEHTLNVKRGEFAFQFYSIIYSFWLETEILKNKINAPGYLEAKAINNWMVIESYRTARFVGSNVPHIDPLKEVQAERLKLGPSGANYPLTTCEAATEALDGGDSDANLEQFSDEIKYATKLKVITENKPAKSVV